MIAYWGEKINHFFLNVTFPPKSIVFFRGEVLIRGEENKDYNMPEPEKSGSSSGLYNLPELVAAAARITCSRTG